MKKAASSHFIFLELIRFCLAIWKSKGCHKLVPHTTSHHQRSELFQKETHVHGFNHSLFLPLFFFFFSFFLLCYNVFSIALTLRHKTTFFFLLTIYYMTSPLLTQLFCPKRESTGREGAGEIWRDKIPRSLHLPGEKALRHPRKFVQRASGVCLAFSK